jgi:hypothetical protein
LLGVEFTQDIERVNVKNKGFFHFKNTPQRSKAYPLPNG